ncbi:hypothetical protein M885DRAFT_524456 [Pelagophyceae sp. CCMP2097]|nr:hypothetical protein M885DRAFT_524456 [Pelagophyceae sp. CCMP2097]
MVGVRCVSELDSRARIFPLLQAASTVQRARCKLQNTTPPRGKPALTFDDLAELLLSDEAARLDAAVKKTRSTLFNVAKGKGGAGKGGAAVVSAIRDRLEAAGVSAKRRLRTGDACAALLGFDVGGHCLGAAGAVAVAERLDVDRDGFISRADAESFLDPPRDAATLRQALVHWIVEHHAAKPRIAFDALDSLGRGLLSRKCLLGSEEGRGLADLGWSSAEVDVAFAALDDDGSGCVDVAEFSKWIKGGDGANVLTYEEQNDRGDPAANHSVCAADFAAGFAAAAEQLRAALLARCGVDASANGALSEKADSRVRAALRAEFAKMDADGSGEMDVDELKQLILAVGVDVVPDESHGAPAGGNVVESSFLAVLDVDSSKASVFEAAGFAVDEVVSGKRERRLILKAVKKGGHDCRVGDEVTAVCGTDVSKVLEGLEGDFLDAHSLNALTLACDFILKKSSIKALRLSRKTATAISEAQLQVLVRAMDADSSGSIGLDEVCAFVLDSQQAGEAEFGLVIESLRSNALSLSADQAGDASAAAFGVIASRFSTKKDQAAHAVPTSAICKWAQSLTVGTSIGALRVSKRQSALARCPASLKTHSESTTRTALDENAEERRRGSKARGDGARTVVRAAAWDVVVRGRVGVPYEMPRVGIPYEMPRGRTGALARPCARPFPGP